jgi:hypothetical protein
MSFEKTDRRDFLKYGSLGTLGALGATSMPGRIHAKPKSSLRADGKLLFVITATGGGSIMDAFLPALRETGTPATLNAFSEGELDQGPGDLRAPKDIDYRVGGPVGPRYSLIDFLRRHGSDTAVVTQQLTSVNHLVAAERSLTGNNANSTRTITEAVAERFGATQLFSNLSMAIAGYSAEGRDPTLRSYAKAVGVGDASLFSFSTHGQKGIKDAPEAELINRARRVRERVESFSAFSRQFNASTMVQRYLQDRRGMTSIESADLIKKLMLIDEVRTGVPLSAYGLESSDEIEALRSAFPGIDYDAFHAQAALGFLLAKYGFSTSVTLGLQDSVLINRTDGFSVDSLPLAFDFSHNHHRGSQNSMWRRLFQVVSGLIDLLKVTDYMNDPSMGKLWDRSLIYVATEFGRSKHTERPDSKGSGHDLNNGNVIISPLIRGGRVYGGIDPLTGLTYGFDPLTGQPDRNRVMSEKDIYSLLAQAMGVSFPGQTDMRAIVR